MTETILTASGIPFKRARFLHPPAETYGIYFDDMTTDGLHPNDKGAERIARRLLGFLSAL